MILWNSEWCLKFWATHPANQEECMRYEAVDMVDVVLDPYLPALGSVCSALEGGRCVKEAPIDDRNLRGGREERLSCETRWDFAAVPTACNITCFWPRRKSDESFETVRRYLMFMLEFYV